MEKPSPADDLHPVTAHSPGRGWLSGHPILHSSWSCRLETETWQHLGGWGCLLSLLSRVSIIPVNNKRGFSLPSAQEEIDCLQPEIVWCIPSLHFPNLPFCAKSRPFLGN